MNVRSLQIPRRFAAILVVYATALGISLILWKIVSTIQANAVAMTHGYDPGSLSLLVGSLITTTAYATYLLSLKKKHAALQFANEIKFRSDLERKVTARTAELADAKRFIDSVIDSLSTVIYVFDLRQKVFSYQNRHFREFLATPLQEDESIDTSFFISIVHPGDHAQLQDRIKKLSLLKDDQIFEFECRILHRSGEYRWVWFKEKVFKRADDGSTLEIMGTAHDITERKATEAALLEFNSRLEQATNFKSQFLANMSHEIRSPLTSIIGYSETLLADELTKKEQDRALQTILKNSTHLLSIINDILDLSKIEAGKLDIENIPVSLVEILSDVDHLMSHKAHLKKLHFEIQYTYPLPVRFQTDPTRLKQVLINLIGNAIKFTQRGSITVKVNFDKKDNHLSFVVSDTGIGLRADQRLKLFQAFSQGDTATTREFGGTGLGLVISSQIIQQLGGIISVESAPGKGSSFTVTIPIEPVFLNELAFDPEPVKRKPSTLSPPKEIPQLSGSVLLAEDGVDTQEYISLLVKKCGLTCVVVDNGAMALASALEQQFDLILLDLQMPIMDGRTTAEKLRECGCNVPIVALTANNMKQDIEAALLAGCTSYLGKPFKRQEFFALLVSYLSPLENYERGESEKEEVVLLRHLEELDLLPHFFHWMTNLPRQVQRLKDATKRESLEEVAEISHQLRGSAYYSPLITAISAQLEDAGQHNLLDETQHLIGVIEMVSDRLCKLGSNWDGQSDVL